MLGKHQLCLLATMASPFSLLVVGDRISRSLVRRGLLGQHFAKKDDAFIGITPAGLRALADEMEAGRLEPFLEPEFQRDQVRIYLNIRKTKDAA